MNTDSSVRFDKISSNFVTSEVHSNSPTIRRLHKLVNLPLNCAVCDIACGAGHLALSFSGNAGRIVAVDPAPNMLDAVRRLATERGAKVETVKAYAEDVPLPSHSFDLVMSRLAPHHFANLAKAFQELVRLAKPEGYIAVIDLQGYEDPEVDEFNHQLEVIHDPTHVRSYTSRYWRLLFEDNGLVVEALEGKQRESPTGVTINRWCEIASSGSDAEAHIRSMLKQAPPDLLDRLDIRLVDNEFRIPVRTILILGRKVLGG